MVEYTKEDVIQHRKDWVSALRSGQYKQGRGYLRSKNNEYCCLGVACELAGVEAVLSLRDRDEEEDEDTYYYGDVYDVNNSMLLPIDVISYYGLTDCEGSYSDNNESFHSLVMENDEHFLNFNEIADIVEKEPKGLFVNV